MGGVEPGNEAISRDAIPLTLIVGCMEMRLASILLHGFNCMVDKSNMELLSYFEYAVY